MIAFRPSVEAMIPALAPLRAGADPRRRHRRRPGAGHAGARACAPRRLFHGGDIRSWLYTILTNLNRNRRRSLARRPSISPLNEDDEPGANGTEAEGRDIERALFGLVEEQRSALLLVMLEGLTYREVAEIQGVPIGTVMSRLGAGAGAHQGFDRRRESNVAAGEITLLAKCG